MPGVFQFSQTANLNSSACPSIDWAESQPPSSINDSARAEMAAVACWRDDISGSILTSGSSAAYQITSNQGFDTLAHLNGQMIAFVPHVTNVSGPVTLTLDGFANLPLRSSPGVELPAGVLIAGSPYICTYNNTDGALYLRGFYGNPYNIPIGGMIDYFGSTTPGPAYAFPQGQQISQTTYASLYALFGSNKYGTDGGELFFLPDMTGRVSAMKETSATRLTATYFGGNSTVLGATGGNEKETIANGNLPANIPSSATTILSMSGIVGTASGAYTSGGNSTVQGTASNNGTAVTTVAINAGGANTPLVTLPPLLITNKILRVL